MDPYGAGSAIGETAPADMHCHLDFAAEGEAIAAQAASAGRCMLSATVDPRDFDRTRKRFAPCSNVHVAAGMHPWWIADGTCGPEEVDLLESLVADGAVRFVGEVGLDFAKRRAGTEDAQVAAFERVSRACAREGGKVMTIHALNSADVVLDVLEATGAQRSCDCILHWFSGSSSQLHRAIGLGCWFSLNARMMQTGRGREYAKVIPIGRLLLETDLPSQAGKPCTYAEMDAALESCLAAIERTRGEACREAVTENALRLLSGTGLS